MNKSLKRNFAQANAIPYGAAELKKQIDVNTMRALGVSMSFFALLLLVYFSLANLLQAEQVNMDPPFRDPGVTEVILDDNEQSSKPVIPPPPIDIQEIGNEYKAGTPIPSPDMALVEDSVEFAPLDHLAVTMSHRGNVGFDLLAPDEFVIPETTHVSIKQKTEESNYEINEVEKIPVVDMAQFNKNIEYPSIARRIGLEGKVLVRVLVGEKGGAIKMQVIYSDSEYFSKAAVDAISKTNILPAIQGGRTVRCWVIIPIEFGLE